MNPQLAKVKPAISFAQLNEWMNWTEKKLNYYMDQGAISDFDIQLTYTGTWIIMITNDRIGKIKYLEFFAEPVLMYVITRGLIEAIKNGDVWALDEQTESFYAPQAK